MKHAFKAILFLLMSLPLTLVTSPAAADNAEAARQFIDGVGQRVVAVVNGSGSEADKQSQLRQLFTENVDIDWMGKFVLGQGAKQANEQQMSKYMQVYREYLLARYTTNFADYAGSKYHITGAKDAGNGEYSVAMQVESPKADQPETQAGYRVRGDGGNLKITDIIIEGVSLITTQRSEFASVLKQKGMDGLISAIETKTQTESSK